MSFENLDLTNDLQEEPTPPEEGGNRTFLIIAGVIGLIALLALACIAIYALVVVPRNKAATNSQRQTLEAQGTAVQNIIDSTATANEMAAIIAAYTATPTKTPIPPTNTPLPTQTPVVVIPTTAVVLATDTPNAQTATAMSLFATLDANATRLASTFTARPSQATSIPNTGFADDFRLPAMLGMAVLLVAVIFLARRLRTT